MWRLNQQLPKALLRSRFRLSRRLMWPSVGIALLLLLYLMSPYLTLWRLDHRVKHGPTAALSGLVDIEAARDQIMRRLNKDQDSRIGEVSDGFIAWVQLSIRDQQPDALANAVTLAWVRQLLLAHSAGDGGFLPAVTYAFYDSPVSFQVKVGSNAGRRAIGPVFLRLERRLLGWRVTAIYY